uniref:Uncharacterized protein n=1 Tax=Rhizophora mucronata TaxID=61149 RepID=A0A2P2Q5B8_RHIMU
MKCLKGVVCSDYKIIPRTECSTERESLSFTPIESEQLPFHILISFFISNYFFLYFLC